MSEKGVKYGKIQNVLKIQTQQSVRVVKVKNFDFYFKFPNGKNFAKNKLIRSKYLYLVKSLTYILYKQFFH